MLPPVSVNPSSSTQAGSGASGGVGAANFYFGGNPNLAALTQGFTRYLPWIIGAAVVLGGAWIIAGRRR